MPNFESSDLSIPTLDGLSAGRIEMLARRLAAAEGDEGVSDEALKRAAQDFASVFYSLVFKELQQSVRAVTEGDGDEQDSEDGGPMTQGVDDFVGMFLPKAIAGHCGDPLTRYIYDSLKDFYRDGLDESA